MNRKYIINLLPLLILTLLLGCRDIEQATVNRGFRWYNRGENDVAIQTFSEVLRSNPSNKYALAGRGDCFAEKKEYEKALVDYNAGIESAPTWAVIYYHRGLCWQEYAQLYGWYDESKLICALADYKKSIELDPTYIAPYINRAFINKLLGKYDLAISDYENIIELQPDNNRAKLEREKTIQARLNKVKPKVREQAPTQKDAI